MNTRVRRSRVVRWLRWLAVIVGVLLLALGLFIVTFDINSYRDTLQTVASRALNRDVELTGELAMGISLVPTLVAKDVRIGNPDWASRRHFAAVDELELQVELLPLLKKQFRITQLLLQGADIELESDRQGNSNWIFANSQKRSAWGGFSGISRVRIRQSKLAYRHAGAGVKQVTIQQADAVLRLDLPVELALKGEYAGQPIDLKLTGNRLDDLIRSEQPWQFTSEAHVGDARLNLKGVVETLEQAWVVNAGVVLQGEDSSVMESLLGRTLPKFGPYQISLQLQAGGEQVRASSVRMDMELPLNGRQIRITEGSGSWGPLTPLQLSLAGEYADQPVDITLKAGTLQAMLSATESWPLQGVLTAAQNRLDVNGMIAGLLGANRLDLQLAMQGENVRLLEPMLAMKLPKIGNYQITAELKGEGGQYVAEISAARVGSSDMRGRLSFDLRERPLRVAVDLTSKALSIDDFIGRSRKPAKRGSEDSALAQSLLWALPVDMELDLQLKAGRVLGLPQLIRNVAVKGLLSNGRLRLSPVAATIPAGRLSGSVDILPGKQQTEVAIKLTSSRLDIGKLFQDSKGYSRVTGRMKAVTLALNGKGARLDELLKQASLEARAAALDLPNFEEGDVDPIAFTDIKVHAAASKPVRLEAQGRVRKVPVTIDLATDQLLRLINGTKPLPITLIVSAADNSLRATGTLGDLTQPEGIKLDVVLKGEESSVMESLLGRTLPKFGPYQISLQLQAGGEQVRASSVRMDMELPLNGRQIRITEGGGSWGPHAPLQLSLAGEYADQPVDITLNAGTLQAMLSATESWPLQGVLMAAQNRLDVNGMIAGLLGANRLDLQLAMQGENVRLLEPMLAMKLPKIGNYQITAELKGEGGQYVAEISAAKVGSSDMRGRLSFDLRERPPRVAVDLTSKALSIDDFTGRSRKPAKRGSEDSALAQSLLWALPVDMELNLQLKAGRVLGLPQLTRNVAVKGQLSNGRLRLSPVAATIPAGRLSASVDILPGKQQTEVAIKLTSSRLDIGKLFQDGKGRPRVIGHMKAVKLALNGKGARLDELLQQASFEMRAAALDLPYFGEWEVGPIALTNIKIHAAAGKPVRLEAQGRVRKVPVTIDLVTDQILRLIKGTKPLPIKLIASAADNRLWATGTLEDLTHPEGIKLDVKLKGQQLKSLEPLLNVNLLRMGPYKLSGKFAGGKGEYRVTSLQGQIDRSDFKGRVMLNTTGVRPLITADLQSGNLHYNDIIAHKPPSPGTEVSAYVTPDVRMPEELLRIVDVSLALDAKRLFIGDVEYTGLNLQAELSDGKLDVSPITTSLKGTHIDSELKLKLTDKMPVAALRFDASEVDYGALLKSLGVSEKFEGKADLNLDITGEGHTLRQLLSMANGHINVIAGKGRINESKLDLWAADLVTSMLTSAWQTAGHTEVNCAVGRFDIINGVANSDTILLDTSRITIAGSGSLNLANEVLNIVLIPSPKHPSFISLAKPARIRGTLVKPEVAIESSLGRGWFLGGLLVGLANPESLLFMFGNLGTLEENPCKEAVKQREDKEAHAKERGSLHLLR